MGIKPLWTKTCEEETVKVSQRRNAPLLYHPTAYHEAGHAVMAYFLGVRLKKVSIVPGKDYVGRLLHGKILRGRYIELNSRNSMEKNALVALSGDIAQKHHAPRSRSGASKDHEEAFSMATMVNTSPEATDAWIKWLKIRAEDTLKLRWALVDAVAWELVKKNELDREEILAVLMRPSRKGNDEKP